MPDPLFKYVTAKGARTFLDTGRLRYSAPLTFNDPYDVQYDFQFPFSRDELQEALKTRLLAMTEGRVQPERSDGVPVEMTRTLQELHDRGDIAARNDLAEEGTRVGLALFDDRVAEYNRRWHEHASGFRVLSLTQEPSHPLMWAHYACGHRGAVLRFRQIAGTQSEIERAIPVEYSDAVPFASSLEQFVNRLTGLPDYQDPDVFQRYLVTKATCWSYENEYRVLKRADPGAGDHMLVEIMQSELEGVILGHKMSEADQAAVRRTLQERWPGATAYGTEKVRGRFELRVREL